MNEDRIDFISCYCDRWCERCPYTSRCSEYACEIAAAMCGDFAQGLELAVGRPRPEDGADEPEDEIAAALEDFDQEMSPEETAAYERQEKAREARVEAEPLTNLAHAYRMLAHRWLSAHYDRVRATADPILAEALDVAAHDAAFVGAKIYRALCGRDRQRSGDALDDDPVQNDWNGSVKVSVISLDRSDAAWRVIAAAVDPETLTLADAARDLRRLALEEFPRALAFIRPGFDEPWR